MSKLAFVTSTGNAQTDRIFKGAFGTIDDAGNFQVAQELKTIHLFALLTPAALKAQGIDLSGSVFEIEVADADLPGIKATMLNALRSQWLDIYALASGLPAGLGRAALEAERETVRKNVDDSIEALNVQPSMLTLGASFHNHFGVPCYIGDENEDGNEDENEEDYAPDNAARAHASEVVSSQWVVTTVAAATAAPTVDTDGVWTPARPLSNTCETSDTRMNYISGSVISTVTMYGDNPGATAAFINELPDVLQQKLPLSRNATFNEVEWHEYARDTQTLTNAETQTQTQTLTLGHDAPDESDAQDGQAPQAPSA